MWAKTTNGTFSSEFRDPFEREPEAFIRSVLSRMNASTLYAWSLWRLPPGARLDDVNLQTWPHEYIQCAGAAEGMTVEVRYAVGNGDYAHDVIGRDGPDVASLPRDHEIAWDEFSVIVAANEVLTADEAGDVFSSYYRGEPLPPGYVARPRDLA